MSETKAEDKKVSEKKDSMAKNSKSFKYIAISIVIAVFISSLFKILGAGLPYYYKDLKVKADITVKGFSKQELTSDLIVWEASFDTWDMNKRTAFSQLKKDREIIKKFLINKGIQESEITFKATWDRQNWDYEDVLIEGSTERTTEKKIWRGYT